MTTTLDNSDTNLSLLGKLQENPSHEDLWPVFVEKYGNVIYCWCLKWGASVEDAEDILQQTLLLVFLKVELFKHGGKFSFRTWLRQIAKFTWLKVVEKTKYTKPLDHDELDQLSSVNALKSGNARSDLLEQFDMLACAEIRSLAFERVRQRVNDVTWQAFILSDHDSVPGKEIAEQLGITLGAVRVAAFRVRTMLNQELAIIDPTFVPPK